MAEDLDPARPLAGRRALVTGASRRLGRAIAVALARAGASVGIHHRRDGEGAAAVAAEIGRTGGRATVLRADLRDAAACTALVARAREVLEGLDLLVNNAAVYAGARLEAMSVRDFDEHLGVNARAPYVLTLEAGRHMKGSGGGDVVNIACASAIRPWPTHVAYSASKAALASMTRSFARLLAPEVRVNAIAPGPVLPPAGEGPAAGRRAVAATLLRRWGSPADVTAAVLFLLRAHYVTGALLAVDGGRSLGPDASGPGASRSASGPSENSADASPTGTS